MFKPHLIGIDFNNSPPLFSMPPLFFSVQIMFWNNHVIESLFSFLQTRQHYMSTFSIIIPRKECQYFCTLDLELRNVWVQPFYSFYCFISYMLVNIAFKEQQIIVESTFWYIILKYSLSIVYAHIYLQIICKKVDCKLVIFCVIVLCHF